ncbi:uncharacterized protein LOC112451498 [Kryptolebias marmoratus]|uniref:uncharacterized protein LOC112451498 n=1 Tax=Kryptolebias marmoratus TaxID=37003 RepID=UPI000D5304C7|nr:uncharacterized protein LOC112451498 [Kryptolebias marmoratus]
MGLKQRIMFTSNLPDASIKYSKATVQDVFLHTVYQGLGHKYNDIQREPLLAEANVKDETILRHVMRVTSKENERRQRLGPVPRQHQTTVRSAQLDMGMTQEERAAPRRNKSAVDTDIISQVTSRINVLTQMVDSMKQGAKAQQLEQACQCSQMRIGQCRRSQSCQLPQKTETAGKLRLVTAGGQPMTRVQPQLKTTDQQSATRGTSVPTAGVLERVSQEQKITTDLKCDSPIKRNEQVARLIGRKALIQCYLIPFDAWVAITVNLPGNEDPNLPIGVPFLVSILPIERPLLGFNVVEELILGQPNKLIPTLITLLCGAISIPRDKAE